MGNSNTSPAEVLKRLKEADPERLANQKELAGIMRVTPSTVRTWAKAGIIPKPGKIGAHLFWKVGNVLRDFQKFVSDQTGDSGARITRDV